MANLFEEKRQKLVEQIARILPLIETERQAYIHAEGGRLAAIIGTGYWNKEIEDFEIFHGRKGDDLALIEARPKDPYDITIEEMLWITKHFFFNDTATTEIYTNFFHMMPEDKKRIELLSRMWHKLTHDTLCTDAEIEELENGHDAFINMKLAVKVKVIHNII